MPELDVERIRRKTAGAGPASAGAGGDGRRALAAVSALGGLSAELMERAKAAHQLARQTIGDQLRCWPNC